MKLAEALMRRADLNRLIGEVSNRIRANNQVEEGEDPEENPEDLRKELGELITEQRVLIFNINRTNLQEMVELGGEKVTLMEAILIKDALLKQHTGLGQFLVGDPRSRMYGYGRRSKEDIKYVNTTDQKEVRKELDRLAARRRRVDACIQKANWTVDLVE